MRTQLDPAIAAQGGLAKWQSDGSVESDLKWSSAKRVKQDHQLFDLRSREGLITGANYSLGASKGEVWIKPDAKAPWKRVVEELNKRAPLGFTGI